MGLPKSDRTGTFSFEQQKGKVVPIKEGLERHFVQAFYCCVSIFIRMDLFHNGTFQFLPALEGVEITNADHETS